VLSDNKADTRDQHSRFASIIILPNKDESIDKLMRLLQNNPLARHRLWKLNRDFGKPSSLLEKLRDHQNKVNWQIYRIYRARNLVAHAGTAPSFIDSLILNLDDYFRSTIGTIVSIARREERESDIERVISDAANRIFPISSDPQEDGSS
jgi:hypothetical protein